MRDAARVTKPGYEAAGGRRHQQRQLRRQYGTDGSMQHGSRGKALLQANADPDMHVQRLWYYGADGGVQERARGHLLQAGADPNSADAMVSKQALLRAGADPKVADSDGDTALTMAR